MEYRNVHTAETADWTLTYHPPDTDKPIMVTVDNGNWTWAVMGREEVAAFAAAWQAMPEPEDDGCGDGGIVVPGLEVHA